MMLLTIDESFNGAIGFYWCFRYPVTLKDNAGGCHGGRGRSRTHQARSRASTALKAAHPTGSDALPRTILCLLRVCDQRKYACGEAEFRYRYTPRK